MEGECHGTLPIVEFSEKLFLEFLNPCSHLMQQQTSLYLIFSFQFRVKTHTPQSLIYESEICVASYFKGNFNFYGTLNFIGIVDFHYI